jgi:hypothetical protein
MNTPSNRGRGVAAALMLGTWLFALCVGFVQACDWHVALEGNGAPCASSASAASSHGACLGECDEFCATDVPVVSRLPLIGGPPDSPLVVPRIARAGVVSDSAPILLPAGIVRPAAAVPPFLRISRLRL